MSDFPVVLLAFSNDPDNHLPLLKREARTLERALQPFDDSRNLQLIVLRGADLEDIIFHFNKYKDQIVLFHYGGHANGTQLLFEDTAASAAGLGKLIAEQKRLKLVFLNGCATKAQVKLLSSLSVPTVIATSSPVGDSQATETAEWFYKSLANKRSIRESFDFASNIGETKEDKAELQISSFRNLFIEGDEQNTEEAFPWGLYTQEAEEERESSEALNWKLPVLPPLPPPPPAPIGDPNYFEGVLEAMAREKKDSSILLDEDKEPLDVSEYPDKIIELLPWPMGAQVRILVARRGNMNLAGMIRLRQQNHVFQMSVRFLTAIYLSEYWDEWQHERLLVQENIYFYPREEDYKRYNYFALVRQLHELFIRERVERTKAGEEESLQKLHLPLLEDFDHFFALDGDRFKQGSKEQGQEIQLLYESIQFFERLQDQLILNAVSEAESAQMSEQANYYLAALLRNLAFVIKYRLCAVRDIEVHKLKHTVEVYLHKLAYLHAGFADSIRNRKKPRNLGSPTDSRSVLLIPDISNMVENLSLMPFVIDKHAYVQDNINRNSDPNIFILAYFKDNIPIYQSVRFNPMSPDNPGDWLEARGPEFDSLREQINIFLKISNPQSF